MPSVSRTKDCKRPISCACVTAAGDAELAAGPHASIPRRLVLGRGGRNSHVLTALRLNRDYSLDLPWFPMYSKPEYGFGIPSYLLPHEVAMTQTIAAHFDGRVIVPDEPVQLRAGQPLRVQLQLVPEPSAAPFAELLRFAADLPDAPTDLSEQHDHYLYGSPKR